MTYEGRRVVGFQRSVDPSTRRGINKKGAAVLNWVARSCQSSAVNLRWVLRLTEDVIMGHQGV